MENTFTFTVFLQTEKQMHLSRRQAQVDTSLKSAHFTVTNQLLTLY